MTVAVACSDPYTMTLLSVLLTQVSVQNAKARVSAKQRWTSNERRYSPSTKSGTFNIYVDGFMVRNAVSEERVDEILKEWPKAESVVVTYFGVELQKWRKNYPRKSDG